MRNAEPPRCLPRRTLLAASATAALHIPRARAAADWPDEVVHIAVSYLQGGSADVLTRLTAEGLRRHLPGTRFVIDNFPGAGGNIGADHVARATPDGTTMLAATLGIYAINPFLYSDLTYNAETDFAQATLIYELPNVAIAAPSLGLRTLGDFIAWAKSRRRDTFFYGTPGVGTSPHMSMVMFAQRAGLSNASHIPFRGAAETLPALLRGDVHFVIDNLTSYMPAIRAGQLTPLAITAAERWPTLPDVPTMQEAGIRDFIVTSWTNLAYPAGTPRRIISTLVNAQHALASTPEHQRRLRDLGARALASQPVPVFRPDLQR